MYKLVKTDTVAILDNGVAFNPIVTLANDHGGRCQISVDDHCYVVRLLQNDGRYKTTPYLFQAVVDVLKTLPTLKHT